MFSVRRPPSHLGLLGSIGVMPEVQGVAALVKELELGIRNEYRDGRMVLGRGAASP